MHEPSRILVLFLLFVAPGWVSGQDYVLTNHGDTLRGDIKVLTYDIFDRIEIVNKEAGKKKKALKATEVKEIFLGGRIHHPAKTPDGYRMIQLKTKGSYLSLYLGHPSKSNNYEVPCLVKKSGGYLEVPGLSFKKLMSNFLSECPAVKVSIETNVLTRKDLDLIIDKFNKCIEDATEMTMSSTTVMAPIDDPKIIAVKNLIDRLEKDTNLKTGKDALDISRDLLQKIRQGKEVPHYLTDGLKSALKDETSYQDDVNALVELIQKK